MTHVNSLTSGEIYDVLKSYGQIDFSTGTPCGELKELIQKATKENNSHISTANEREAIGIAAGAWLAGRNPLVYMQNSGLFASSNELASILVASEMPIPLVVAWRGCPGETATQHLATGQATIPLLDSLKIGHRIDPDLEELKMLIDQNIDTKQPYCALKTREKFNSTFEFVNGVQPARKKGIILKEDLALELAREDALGQIFEIYSDEISYFSSTGLISRSVFENHDSPNQFYNAGGFGFTSSIALGFSVASQGRPTTIIEGDGSVLANLGNINLIGSIGPREFTHIVLNNYSYGSCSYEPTNGSELIPEIAAMSGYKMIRNVRSRSGLNLALEESRQVIDGPVLIQVDINKEGRRDFRRPLGMPEIASRFRQNFIYRC